MGVIEWRRSVRALRGDSARLAMLAFAGLFGLLTVVGGAAAIVFLIGEGSGLRVTDPLRGNLTLFWLFGGFMIAQRAAQLYDRADAEALLLTTVSARTVAAGLVAGEALRVLTLAAFPILLWTGAFVYATGSLAAAVTVPAAGVLFLTTAVAVGVAAGKAVALVVARVPFVARHKTALGGVLVLAFFGGYTALQVGVDGVPVDIGMLAVLPAGWVTDLAAVGLPITGSLPRAIAAAVGGPLLLGGLLALDARVATAYWYGDRVDPTDEGDGDAEVGTSPGATETGRDALASAIAPLSMPDWAGGPARRVAQLALLRTRRQPARLSFLLAPLVIVGSTLVSTATAGGGAVGLGPLPVVVALGVAWLAGAAFGLNPLGDEGPVLPMTLLSGVGGRGFVRGLCLPGALVGVPLATLGTAASAVAAGYGTVDAAGLVLLALVMSAGAVGLAPGIGTRFPRFEAVTVGRSREVVPPALSAVVVYSLLVGLSGSVAALSLLAPGLARALLAALVAGLPSLVLSLLAGQGLPTAGLAAWFAGLTQPIGAVPLGTLRTVGYAGPLALLALAGARGYRVAARRFEAYRVN
jgi:hypothetical protein